MKQANQTRKGGNLGVNPTQDQPKNKKTPAKGNVFKVEQVYKEREGIQDKKIV